MANSIGSGGISVDTLSQVIANLTTALQAIYGSDVILSSDTPDGQLINILAQAIVDLEDLLVSINAMFDPDQAVGVILDQRVAINGITRQAGTYTVQPVTIYTTGQVTLYGLDQTANPVFTVADQAGNQYELLTTQNNINPGSTGTSLSFQAVDQGPVQSGVGTITVPVTVVVSVSGGPAGSGIYNPSTYSTLGEAEETDAALRLRRQQSVALSSQGYLGGLQGALANISGVTSSEVFENTSDSTDGDGVPGHSIWVIVSSSPSYPTSDVAPYDASTTYSVGNLALSGGVVYASGQNNNTGNPVTDTAYWWPFDQVAWAVYLKRNAGCGMYGSISAFVTQLDGSQFQINYDVVEPEPVFIAFYATGLAAGSVPNIAAILNSATGLPSTYLPGVNGEVNINTLADAVRAIDPNTLVTMTPPPGVAAGTPATGGFSTTVGGTYTPTLQPSSKKYQLSVTAANIIILPMILSPQTVSVAHGLNQQFTPLGGYGAMTYSIPTNNSGGSISSSGLYTAGATSNVTDIVKVVDQLGNSATATVTVT